LYYKYKPKPYGKKKTNDGMDNSNNNNNLIPYLYGLGIESRIIIDWLQSEGDYECR
jgi:hypothetical protein